MAANILASRLSEAMGNLDLIDDSNGKSPKMTLASAAEQHAKKGKATLPLQSFSLLTFSYETPFSISLLELKHSYISTGPTLD